MLCNYRWSQGMIHGVEFEVDDEYWSRNVKKGIIGLLQVSLRHQQSVSSRSLDSDLRRSSWSINRFRSPFVRHSYRDNDVNSAYVVMEVSGLISFTASSLNSITKLKALSISVKIVTCTRYTKQLCVLQCIYCICISSPSLLSPSSPSQRNL